MMEENGENVEFRVFKERGGAWVALRRLFAHMISATALAQLARLGLHPLPVHGGQLVHGPALVSAVYSMLASRC